MVAIAKIAIIATVIATIIATITSIVIIATIIVITTSTVIAAVTTLSRIQSINGTVAMEVQKEKGQASQVSTMLLLASRVHNA